MFERGDPCLLREFGLRHVSGGEGRYHGGEDCIRDIEFRQPMDVAILSNRRSHRPYGLQGCQDGALGVNLFIKKIPGSDQDRVINLGPKNSIRADATDRIVIMTPGGGGWGKAVDDGGESNADDGASSLITGIKVGAQKVVSQAYQRGMGNVAAFSAAQISN